MKSDQLLRALGSVKDEYIEEIMTESVKTARRRAGSRNVIASIAASLAIVVLGTGVMAANGAHVDEDEMTLSSGVQNVQMAHNSVIMIDVNPSIRVEVNDRDVVVNVEGLNEESQLVLEGLELTGKDYKTAVTEIVTSLQEKEYITNLKNSILISVAASNDDIAQQILKSTVDTVEQIDKAVDYGFSILGQIISHSDSAAATAEKFGISEGRVDIINKFISEHGDYSFDKLVENNIQLLNQLFEYVGLPEGVERIGSVAGVVPEECEEKLRLDELSGDELVSFASAISDFYDKLSKYYKPSDVAKRIGYEFSIVESSTEDGQKLWAVLAESLTKNIGNHGALIGLGQSTITDWITQSEIAKVIKHIGAAVIPAAGYFHTKPTYDVKRQERKPLPFCAFRTKLPGEQY